MHKKIVPHVKIRVALPNCQRDVYLITKTLRIGSLV